MRWYELTSLIVLLFFVAYIWFINIRWTIRFWRNQISDKCIDLPSEKDKLGGSNLD